MRTTLVMVKIDGEEDSYSDHRALPPLECHSPIPFNMFCIVSNARREFMPPAFGNRENMLIAVLGWGR